MLLYFLRGSLPWRKIRGSTTRATWDLIRAKKMETMEILTVKLPEELQTFYRYVRGLEFYDLPDYEGLRRLLRGLALREKIEFDGKFDWIRERHWREKHERHGSTGSRKARACTACQACAKKENDAVRR
jgi:casein kinase I homolog HRR25